jgi:hypothetical protein
MWTIFCLHSVHQFLAISYIMIFFSCGVDLGAIFEPFCKLFPPHFWSRWSSVNWACNHWKPRTCCHLETVLTSPTSFDLSKIAFLLPMDVCDAAEGTLWFIILWKKFLGPLEAWSSRIVSACHRGDWSYGSCDRIPPGYTYIGWQLFRMKTFWRHMCRCIYAYVF